MNVELRDGLLRPLLDRFQGQAGSAKDWPGPRIEGSLASEEDEERWIWNALPQALKDRSGDPPIGDLMSLKERVAQHAGDVITIRHPMALALSTKVEGVAVRIEAESDLPFGRQFRLVIHVDAPVVFTLKLRLPHWADDIDFDVPDHFGELEYEEGFVVLRRTWHKGDTLAATFHAEPQWMISMTSDRDLFGRVALVHGPLVFALRADELRADPGFFAALASEEITMEENGQIYVQGLLDKIDPQPYTPFVPYEGEEQAVEVRMVPFHECISLEGPSVQVWLRKL